MSVISIIHNGKYGNQFSETTLHVLYFCIYVIPKQSLFTFSKHQPKYADKILNDSPSSYGPFDIAFKIPCWTESNRFLSEIIS